MSYLSFIDDETLIAATKLVIDSAPKAEAADIGRNQLDPFGALFECAISGMDYEAWTKKESRRQIQKTLQNKIGDFHQKLIGGLPNCEDVPQGQGLDTLNVTDGWCAEIKNKFNTTKGNHLPRLYDDIENWVDHYTLKYGKPFTGYYVQIIPRKPEDMDTTFTPSDGGSRRPTRKDIRQISGALFYEKATGIKDALKQVYDILPTVMEEEFDVEIDFDVTDFSRLFKASIKA